MLVLSAEPLCMFVHSAVTLIVIDFPVWPAEGQVDVLHGFFVSQLDYFVIAGQVAPISNGLYIKKQKTTHLKKIFTSPILVCCFLSPHFCPFIQPPARLYVLHYPHQSICGF